MVPVVQKAGAAEIETTTSVIARAFADDPVAMWIFGSPELFQKALRILMKDVYLPRGFVTQVENKGASMWLPPGASNDLTLWALLRFISSIVPGAGFDPILRSLKAADRMDSLKPKEPFLYLFAIGVDPSAQGQGLGSLLIKDGLRLADAEGMPAYLESSKRENIPLYERHGFEVVEEARIADDAPQFWPMLRQPRS
ncbi:MAG: GNAT family N-acetyltransferase [Pseudomonadota bacterium]